MSIKGFVNRYFGSPVERREAWFKKTRRIAKKYNFHIYEKHMAWKEADFFQRACVKTKDLPGIPDTRSYVLQSVMKMLATVEGDIAECGVFNGKSTYFMLCADEKKRGYCLFDSWQGLSEPSQEDIMINSAKAGWHKGSLETPIEVVKNTLAEFSNVEYFQGWIPTRFDEVKDRTFALLHVDVDLYEPTRDSLNFFFPRLAKGGAIVCDDYGSDACPGARKACDEFCQSTGMQLLELPTGQCLMLKTI